MADSDREAEKKELEALTAALNRSAERVQTLWLSFIVFMLYLAIAAGTTTHRMLFRGDPLKLPVLNIDLPLLGFYTLAPVLLVIFQFYVLLNLMLLARTASSFEAVLPKVFPPAMPGNDKFRMRIENALFAQLVAGAKLERLGRNAWLLGFMSFLTVAVAPAAALLLIEIRFLPYHHDAITWLHRGLLLLSLGLSITFWPAYRNGFGERWGPASAVGWAVGVAAASVVMAYASLVANFPGEKLYAWTEPTRLWLGVYEASFRTMKWPEFAAAEEKRKKDRFGIVAPFLAALWPASALSLRNEDLIDDSRRKQIADRRTTNGEAHEPSADGSGAGKNSAGQTKWIESINLRDRNLIAADLTNADVEQAEFSGADLSRSLLLRTWTPRAHFANSDTKPAQLKGASLAGAQLQGASLDRALLQGAALKEAQLQGASLVLANLQGASLINAQLQGASLGVAQLQGASLVRAQLQGASLDWAQLQGASLAGAQLQGASLDRAELQGASLDWAQLQGASLYQAQLQGASLDWAHLQGASLEWAQLQGASLAGARLQGALLDRAGLQGSLLDGTQLQGASLDRAQLRGASLSGALTWRADVLNANAGGALIALPFSGQFFDCENIRLQIRRLYRICTKGEKDFKSFMRVFDAVPEGGLKKKATLRLTKSLKVEAFPDQAPIVRKIAARWTALAKTPLPPADLLQEWPDIACEEIGAPYVARALLGRLRDYRFKTEAAAKAARADFSSGLLRKAYCLGAKGLTDAEKAELQSFIDAAKVPASSAP
ncbi:pentapeptide repeat protein [Methylocella silvestris BL2]|uniref:Pentapeptide repeat protein n=1 Tax=Methylocella silvestris (strain DSM 15510 / CIP 108128 / LMG 27833 / NCIMB 13906 / BL2) TaxID=395965 RepID=B8EM91_METSB|nr:pentapeptide repeat-containing protein [Methylocella silvestris]ACK51480.1 pentapeptide repeat protein [Methylocella silvestris BL2]